MSEKRAPRGSTAPPLVVVEALADDSDKTFVVPAGAKWRPRSIFVNLTTTATVGNRRVLVTYTDANDNVLASVMAGLTQAASLAYSYTFAPGLPKDTAVVDLNALSPLPDLVLTSGQKVRVRDNAAIAPAADDMIVRMLVESA